jgi:fructosamine-3-kinase
MNVPEPVVAWCRARGWGDITKIDPLGGGCIHRSCRLTTQAGPSLFLKTNPDVPADLFAREAEGLQALAVDGGPRLPQAHLWQETFLLLEDLAPGGDQTGYWERLGRELAQLHRQTSARFGFDHDNFIGLTPQPNPWTADGAEFFAEHRLLHQARLARQAGRLTAEDVRRVEALAESLAELVPGEAACLIHGDLWSGNVLRGPQGEPCLIDPACHYGWAEAELAMTELFGGFADGFYRAYAEVHPLVGGWRERFPVYNLYHLLNHVNLFGAGYLSSVRSILRRFVS